MEISLETWGIVVSLVSALSSWHFSRRSQKSADTAHDLNHLVFKTDQAERIRKLALTAGRGEIERFREKLSEFLPALKAQGYSRSEMHSLFILPTHVEMQTKAVGQDVTDAYLADKLFGSAMPENMQRLNREWKL